MFKSVIAALVVASAVAVPAFAYAADGGQVTRSEVKAQLIQLERAGYNPASDQTTYPADIQAAEARVNAPQREKIDASATGGADDGASASGHSRFLSRIVRPAADANPVDLNRP